MNKYVLILCKDAISEVQKNWIENYIASLKPVPDILANWNHVSPSAAVLLQQNSPPHWAVLSNACDDSENIMWNKILSYSEEFFPKKASISIFQNLQIKSSHKNSSPPSVEQTTRLAQAIHTLSDQLPHFGTYMLDVLVDSKLLSKTEACDHMDLYGAMYRLVLWHRGFVTILVNDNQQSSVLDNWRDLLAASINTGSALIKPSSVLWRGGFQIGMNQLPENCYFPGLYLTTDEENQSMWFTLKEVLGLENNSPVVEQQILPIIVSSHIEVLDECSASTVPTFLLCPIRLKLCTHSGSSLMKKASEFLSFVNRKNGVSTLLRLKYSFSTKQDVCDFPLTTEEWRKTVVSGNIKSPLSALEDTKHITFAAIGDGHSSLLSAFLYALKDPCDLQTNLFNSLLTPTSLSLVDLENKRKEAKELLQNLPHYSAESWKYLQKVIQDVQKHVLQDWTVYLQNTKSESPVPDISELFYMLAMVENTVLSKFGVDIFAQPLAVRDVKLQGFLNENNVDPFDWPERIALLQKEFHPEERKGRQSSDMLGGIPPPPVQSSNTITITAKDFAKYFSPNGEAKPRAVKSEIVHSLSSLRRTRSSSQKSQWSLQQVLQTPWPDIAHCSFHDVYYNVNIKMEELEIKCNRIKEHCIIHETALICNMHQESPPYTTIVIPQQKSNHLETRVSPQLNKKRKLSQPLRRSPRKHSEKRHSGNNFIPPQLNYKKDTQITQSSSKYPSSGNKNQIIFPALRRSPRKHNQSLHPSEVQDRKKMFDNKKKLADSKELSEKHKMKLREAVACALEAHGISLNHPAFKSCGRKLFVVCKAFVKDVIGKGSTSAQMRKIAEAHAKQVVEFEMQKHT